MPCGQRASCSRRGLTPGALDMPFACCPFNQSINSCLSFSGIVPIIHHAGSVPLLKGSSALEKHALTITVESVDDVPVIRAVGELEIATVSEMRAVLAEVSERRPRALVFDFRQISYMDSSGLGILVSAKKRLGADRGEVVLITEQPAVLKALSLSGLDQIIRIFSGEEEYFGVEPAAR